MAFNSSYNDENFFTKFFCGNKTDQQIFFRNILATILKFKILLFDNFNFLKKQLLPISLPFVLQLKTQQTVEKENFKKQSKSKFIKRV
jgi:phage regulator Rha-like protein